MVAILPPTLVSGIIEPLQTRVRERQMRRFKSPQQAQRFLEAQAAIYTLFNLGGHLIGAEHYRKLREGAFSDWKVAVA